MIDLKELPLIQYNQIRSELYLCDIYVSIFNKYKDYRPKNPDKFYCSLIDLLTEEIDEMYKY